MNKERLLFCFSFAGGTTIFFDQIEKAIKSKSEKTQLIKLEYSGHGKRVNEPLYNSFDELSEDLMYVIRKTLLQYPDIDYDLFGYSMGSLSIFSIIQEIVKEGIIRKPRRLFLAAHPPKTMKEFFDISNDEIEEWTKNRMIAFGGIPQTLISNRTFWRMYLPIYISDFRMIASYDFNKVSFISDIPTTVFYSEEDTPFSAISEWKRYFTNIDFVEYDGPHFFIEKYYDDMADIICRL